MIFNLFHNTQDFIRFCSLKTKAGCQSLFLFLMAIACFNSNHIINKCQTHESFEGFNRSLVIITINLYNNKKNMLLIS